MYVCKSFVDIHVYTLCTIFKYIAVAIVMLHRLCEQYMNNISILFMIVLNLFVSLWCVCTSGLFHSQWCPE